VIEFGPRPGCRRMTRLAGRRESSLHVIGVLRIVEISLVTAYAIRRGAFVLAVDVTLRARDCLVRSCQRKSRCAVIELGPCPRGGVVTSLTRSWKSSLHVIGIVRVVEVLLMAIDAIRGRAFVLPVDVTLGTLQRHVRTGKGESGHRRMIEFGPLPCGCVVALLTRLRESGSNVVRILRSRKVFLVATYAIR
jgi:hypothetical protein